MKSLDDFHVFKSNFLSASLDLVSSSLFVVNADFVNTLSVSFQVCECVNIISGEKLAVKIIDKRTIEAEEKGLLRTEIAGNR